MIYERVIPRDLFNEAKLLKCLGQVALLIHERVGIRWPLEIEHEDTDQGFNIEQDPDHGGLNCTNLRLTLNGEEVYCYTKYNSKEPYPLWAVDPNDYCEYEVLADDGSIHADFKAWLDAQH